MKIRSSELVGKGYFFPELPPPFTTSELGRRYSQLFKDDALDVIAKTIHSTECVFYAIPKAGYSRRILGIPNPLHYTLLAQALEKNASAITRNLHSTLSCSTPVVDSKVRAFKKQATFSSFRRQCFLRSKEARYELKIDISRYYPTIYTHIIPWALHGRDTAKAKQSDSTLLGNVLDRHTRNLQSGQTMGIPIGPDGSLIISEIIGARLDAEICKRFKDIRGARYIDDYYFYFTTKAEAERALKFIQSLLADYLLTTNDVKTGLREFPFSTDTEWVISLRSLRATCFKDDSEPEQEADIRQFFSAAFDWAEKYPGDEVMKFAASMSYEVKISDANWDYYQSWITKMALYDPYTLPEVCAILFRNRNRVDRQALKALIHQLIEDHTERRHSFEVAWTLWLARIFRIRIPAKIAKGLFNSNDVVPTLMALDLRNKGLISKKVSVSTLAVDLTTESLKDGRWLLAYEACLQGWLKPKKSNEKFIKNHSYFSKLLKAKVSFFDADILEPVLDEGRIITVSRDGNYRL